MHLFTPQVTRAAEELIDLLATYNMNMALQKGIPTLQHMVMKRYSRPEYIFLTEEILDWVISCKVDQALRPVLTDHFLITTKIVIAQGCTVEASSYNYRKTNWDLFKNNLMTKLNLPPPPPPQTPITNTEQLDEAIHQHRCKKMVEW